MLQNWSRKDVSFWQSNISWLLGILGVYWGYVQFSTNYRNELPLQFEVNGKLHAIDSKNAMLEVIVTMENKGRNTIGVKKPAYDCNGKVDIEHTGIEIYIQEYPSEQLTKSKAIAFEHLLARSDSDDDYPLGIPIIDRFNMLSGYDSFDKPEGYYSIAPGVKVRESALFRVNPKSAHAIYARFYGERFGEGGGFTTADTTYIYSGDSHQPKAPK